MANPPTPLTHTASPKTYGTILHYGLADIAVTGILIDSYKRDTQYADTQEIVDQTGKVVGVRMNDFRANVSIEGRVLDGTAYTAKVGDKLVINGDTIVMTSVSYNGQAKGFHTLSISGTAYEGITELAPA